MDSDRRTKRLHAIFSGRVQGVGFRYTVCRIATSFDITGFVRNLWDGDVEVVAEGSEMTLTDFLHRIRSSQLCTYISGDLVTWEDPTGEFDRFGVAY